MFFLLFCLIIQVQRVYKSIVDNMQSPDDSGSGFVILEDKV